MRLRRAGDPAITNFGYGNRDPKLAVKNLLKIHYQSFGTRAHLGDRFAIFWSWISKQHPEIRDLRALMRQHIEEYALYLAGLEQQGRLSVATTHNYLSAVNQILSRARGDDDLLVRPVRDAGFQKRMRRPRQLCGRARLQTEPKTLNEQILQILIDLHLHFGLRLEESIKLDAKKAFSQAVKLGKIQVIRGTKGGRKRSVDIEFSEQVEVLALAAKIQESLSHTSLCPPDMSYAKFRGWCYRQRHHGAWDEAFHGSRHVYGQSRYERIAGFPCPAALGLSKVQHRKKISKDYGLTCAQVKERDKAARQAVSLALGHSREEISSAYCG